MKRTRKTAVVTATAPALAVRNSALPASTGGVRVLPTNVPWNSKAAERMSRSRDEVIVSRFLQECIPQIEYCIQFLPREAIGKGIGLKSISQDPGFRAAATAHFKSWADSHAVDLRKEHTFFELQPRWLAALLGDGECFQQSVIADTPAAQSWSLNDKSKRAIQVQTFLRDQLTNGKADPKAEGIRLIDGLIYNRLDQLQALRINQDDTITFGSTKYLDVPIANGLGGRNVFHLKDNRRFNQYHGRPILFSSKADLLDVIDLKALRKHSAKVRASLLGATSTRDGKAPTAIQAAMAAEQTGSPAADTGKRFMEIGEGAVMIPLATEETFNFFTSNTEAVPFRDILADLLYPFIFSLGYPVEYIFLRGKVGGTEYRGLMEQVRRAHQNLRLLLQPLLQWLWEKVIGTAIAPGGALYQYAAVPDWNVIDFIPDADPSVDLGRDHKADMERLDSNLMTAEDFIESRTGQSGQSVRRARIDEQIDDIAYAIERGALKNIPPSIATILALPSKKLSSASGLLTTLAPESIAADLAQLDAPPKE